MHKLQKLFSDCHMDVICCREKSARKKKLCVWWNNQVYYLLWFINQPKKPFSQNFLWRIIIDVDFILCLLVYKKKQNKKYCLILNKAFSFCLFCECVLVYIYILFFFFLGYKLHTKKKNSWPPYSPHSLYSDWEKKNGKTKPNPA